MKDKALQEALPKPENMKWLLDAANQVINELKVQEHLDSDTFRWLCNAVGQVERDLSRAALASQPEQAPILDLQLFYDQLVDGQIIKESDGEPWPLTKSEAKQIVDALFERLKVVWPLRIAPAPADRICNRCKANLCEHDNCTDWTCARSCSKCAKVPIPIGNSPNILPAPAPAEEAGTPFDPREWIMSEMATEQIPEMWVQQLVARAYAAGQAAKGGRA